MHTHEANKPSQNMKINSNASKQDSSNDGEVQKLIRSHDVDNPYLDLSNRSLHSIPNELFLLPHLQHLYLEGNFLKELPENFFDRLPALKWLDLRNNKLKALPVSIGRHQSIKNLLLEGNFISHLPLQMGITKCLTGLSLRGNPLLTPPQHIVDQGVYVILSYLYQELQNRTKEVPQDDPRDSTLPEKLNISDDTNSTSDEEILTEAINITDRHIPSPMSDDFELVRHGPTPISASLHKPVSLQEYQERYQTNGTLEGFRNKSRNGKKELSLLNLRQQESSRKEQLRSMRERQTAHADQRRKEESVLEEWRKETRRRQQVFPRSKTEINLKPPPFGVDKNPIEFHENVHEEKVERVLPTSLSQRNRCHMFVEIPNKINEVNRDDADKQEDEEVREVIRNKKVLPNSVIKKNEAVQQRMKQHSSQIQHRIKKLRDDAGPLKQTGELQRQLLDRKMAKDPQLEYRFRAFTGDSVSINSGSHKTSSM